MSPVPSRRYPTLLFFFFLSSFFSSICICLSELEQRRCQQRVFVCQQTPVWTVSFPPSSSQAETVSSIIKLCCQAELSHFLFAAGFLRNTYILSLSPRSQVSCGGDSAQLMTLFAAMILDLIKVPTCVTRASRSAQWSTREPSFVVILPVMRRCHVASRTLLETLRVIQRRVGVGGGAASGEGG